MTGWQGSQRWIAIGFRSTRALRLALVVLSFRSRRAAQPPRDDSAGPRLDRTSARTGRPHVSGGRRIRPGGPRRRALRLRRGLRRAAARRSRAFRPNPVLCDFAATRGLADTAVHRHVGRILDAGIDERTPADATPRPAPRARAVGQGPARLQRAHVTRVRRGRVRGTGARPSGTRRGIAHSLGVSERAVGVVVLESGRAGRVPLPSAELHVGAMGIARRESRPRSSSSSRPARRD